MCSELATGVLADIPEPSACLCRAGRTRGASRSEITLLGDDVFRLGPFLALRYFHGDPLAFLERLEAFHLDGAVVNEDVLSAFSLNEAKSLVVVEPLDGSADSFACHIYL